MRVEQLMSRPVITCDWDNTLHTAACLMWEHDCGVIPVVEEGNHLVGIITDRDVCMAAYITGRPLVTIPVAQSMSSEVVTCHIDDSIADIEALMAKHRIRRMPVIDDDGHPVGMVSINDLAREAVRTDAKQRGKEGQQLTDTLAAISQPRDPMALQRPA